MRTTFAKFGWELRSLDEKNTFVTYRLQLTIRAPKHHFPRALYRERCFFSLHVTFSISHRFHPNGLQNTRNRMQILWDISSRQKVQNKIPRTLVPLLPIATWRKLQLVLSWRSVCGRSISEWQYIYARSLICAALLISKYKSRSAQVDWVSGLLFSLVEHNFTSLRLSVNGSFSRLYMETTLRQNPTRSFPEYFKWFYDDIVFHFFIVKNNVILWQFPFCFKMGSTSSDG